MIKRLFCIFVSILTVFSSLTLVASASEEKTSPLSDCGFINIYKPYDYGYKIKKNAVTQYIQCKNFSKTDGKAIINLDIARHSYLAVTIKQPEYNGVKIPELQWRTNFKTNITPNVIDFSENSTQTLYLFFIKINALSSVDNDFRNYDFGEIYFSIPNYSEYKKELPNCDCTNEKLHGNWEVESEYLNNKATCEHGFSFEYSVEAAPYVYNTLPTPKISQKVKVSNKYRGKTTYDITVNVLNNHPFYDGMEYEFKADGFKYSYYRYKYNSGNDFLTATFTFNTPFDTVVYSRARAILMDASEADIYNSDNQDYPPGTNDDYIDSEFSKTLSTKNYIPLKNPLLVIASNNKKTVELVWTKVNNAKGYEIYRSTMKNKGYKKIKTIKKASITEFINKNLKSKTMYYYKIRAYKMLDGKKVYSKFSSIKKIKIR